MKEQFIDFGFMVDIDLGNKFGMSYRVRCLLNESIDLLDYGTTIQSILFSPIIGPVLEPENNFDTLKKELRLEFYIDPQEALEATEEQFFVIHIEGLLSAIQKLPPFPKNFDFDFDKLTEDIESLKPKYDQLKEVV